MPQRLHIFMEYRIKENKLEDYETVMKQIHELLPEFGAEKIEWYVADDQPRLYVEKCQVPTKSHYYALKKWRQSRDHRIFGQLDELVDGGLDAMNMWAFVEARRK